MQTTATSNTLQSRQAYQERRHVVDIDMDFPKHLSVKRKRFTVAYQEGDVQDLNTRFVQLLEDIRHRVQDQGEHLQRFSDDEYQHFMQDLRKVGEEAYACLPEGVGEYIAELEEDERERGISLDFTFPPGMAFLWDIIYPDNPDTPLDPDLFWGLRYPVGSLCWESDVRDSIDLQKGIFASWHEQLNHSKGELYRLEQRVQELQQGHMLEVIFHHLEAAISVGRVTSEQVLQLFHQEDFAYGIVHFACHCVHDQQAGASSAYLCVTAHQQEVEIQLGRLNPRARHKKGFRHRPMVFLNACESATPLHLLQSLNFPNSLLNFGAGGVIATVCTIPDNFASAFASKFYENLLEKSSTSLRANIGEALLETRRYFLEEYNNPLGLAYGLYAVSNQQLRIL
jgi:hypothetical protein